MQWIEKEKAAGMAVSAEMGTVYRKVLWRTVPFLFLCYVLNYMDRVNISFAALQFRQDLHISVASYGFGHRHFLHRLRAVRGAEQSADAAHRRAPHDDAHHGVVGAGLDLHAVRP